MKKYISLAVVAASVLGLSSCLKDKNLVLDPAKSPSVIEFSTISDNPIDTGANITSYSRAFPIVNSSTTTIDVHYTGGSVALSDITVNVEASQASLDAFNGVQDDDNKFTMMPSDLFTIATPTVVIKKGTSKATVTLTVKTTSPFSLAENYAIPLTIKSVSSGSISHNYGAIMLNIKAQNALDADYKATGFVFHPSAPRGVDDTYHVGTDGPITSQIPMADLGSANYIFDVDVNGSALSNYVAKGAVPPAPASGLMTADNPGHIDYSTAAPDAPGAGEWVSSKYNNTYDAATKTFWLHFGYATGGNGQNTWSRQFYMKLVKK